MLIYTRSITSRLIYITGFIGKQITGYSCEFTNSKEGFAAHTGVKINYSEERITPEEIWIRPHGLLFEKYIEEHVIECFTIGGIKAFFKTEGDLSFDVFAAAFYLLSRYEEYLPHKKDKYGLYAHENSLAWKEGFLDQPLVNQWIELLKGVIKDKYLDTDPGSYRDHKLSFSFLPTYDIDMAWSYLHKGWWRNTGGRLRSIIKGKWSEVKERNSVLSKKQPDPYDAYHWMNELHHRYKLRPYYFFLLAKNRGRYDKNISPSKKAMRQLIYEHAVHYPVGIHPSWQSGDDPYLLKEEINTLVTMTGVPVHTSRQHYIRFDLPQTFRRLIDSGIRMDFSMGYGSINGFRASVATPFYWYDLQEEKQTELLLYPFCYMDANSYYEQNYCPEQALEEMRHYYKVVKEVNGMFCMIWHNSFLGSEKEFAGWKEVYEQIIREIQ